MFIQVIEGRCADQAGLRRELDTWHADLSGAATGWLGGTYGFTDEGEFVGVVRFDSREAAERNSARPEQDAWWRRASACFAGDVTFHDCDEVTTFLDGGSDDAGFVQVIEAKVTDRERFLALQAATPVDLLRAQRPDIIGGTVALDADGWACQTVAFRTEAKAREGERKEIPEEVRAQLAEEMSLLQDVTYKDLRRPFFASP